MTPKEKPCKTPKQNTEPVNKTASLVTPFFDVPKINTIENQNDETPSSPILSSKNRSRNTSKISSKLLLPPDSDETEDEITSPVFRHLVHLVTMSLGPTVKACLFLLSYGICDSYCKSNILLPFV